MFDKTIEQVRARLNQPLPGEEVQYKMAPEGRAGINSLFEQNNNPRKSAVMVLLFPDKELVKTVFIVRPVYQGVHSGQVAFPGGKQDESDHSLAHTALRETHEEVGVDPSSVEIIGKLTEVYIPPSNFLVTPYIGFTQEHPVFVPDNHEVDKIVTHNLFDLNRDDLRAEKKVTVAGGFEIQTPYYNINGETLWGATAMMVSELNKVIEEARAISI